MSGMRFLMRTVVAGISGAVVRLALGTSVLFFGWIGGQGLSQYAQRGEVDFASLIPRTRVAEAQGIVRIEGATADEASRLREAVESMDYPVDTSLFSVKVVEDDPMFADGAAAALFVYPENVVYMDRETVRVCGRQELQHVMAHEIGHSVDLLLMDDSARQAVSRLRGYPSELGWEGSSADWERRPQEDFAEVFATLVTPGSSQPIATAYGHVTDAEALRRIIDAYAPGTAASPRPVSDGSFSLASAGDAFAANPVEGSLIVAIAGLWSLTGAYGRMERVRRRALRTARVPHNVLAG